MSREPNYTEKLVSWRHKQNNQDGKHTIQVSYMLNLEHSDLNTVLLSMSNQQMAEKRPLLFSILKAQQTDG